MKNVRQYLVILLAAVLLASCAPGSDVRKAVAESYSGGKTIATAKTNDGILGSSSSFLVCVGRELHIVIVESFFYGTVRATGDEKVLKASCEN